MNVYLKKIFISLIISLKYFKFKSVVKYVIKYYDLSMINVTANII